MLDMTEFNLSLERACELLKVNRRTLLRWRGKGYGPRHLKIGTKLMYSYSEIVKWLEEYNDWLKVKAP